MENSMDEQVIIKVQTDKYTTADFLRQLANEIEMSDDIDGMEFETANGFAEVTIF